MIASATAFGDVAATLGPLERMSREAMLDLQFRKLKRQLERLHRTNAYYRAKLDAARVQPGDIRTLEDFRRRIPLSTKADFLRDQEEHPPFGSRLGVPRDEVVLVNLTGGTSGQGQEVYGRTNADIAMQGYFHTLPWFMAGLRAGDIAINCVPAGGLTTGGWGPGEGFRIAGATALSAGGALSTDQKVALMARFGEIHFIYASTNYIHTLSEAFRARGVTPAERFPMMKALFAVAEGYPMAWARAIEHFWGCPLHEGYGSTQGAGFVSATCERGVVRADRERGLMHIFDWHNVIEVVNPETGEPVAPGEEGEIILTNLDLRGSPVLRFSTRDRARWFPHDACGCGRAWACIEAGTVGRYDDMMKIRGNNVWPLAIDQAVFAHPEVAEYVGRVYVDPAARTEVEVKIALKPEHQSAGGEELQGLVERIRTAIKRATNVSMEVRVVPRSELPTFTYKARRWSDERQAGYREGANA